MQNNGLRSEHEEQAAFFKLVDLYSNRYPELLNIYAVPNGSLRNKVIAAKLKAEGVKPGVPDISVDVASRGYYGLKIEMKRSDGGAGLSKYQANWFKRLSKAGYLCRVAKGADEAWKILCWYLQIMSG